MLVRQDGPTQLVGAVLEERGWTALSSGETAAREFYDTVLDRKVMMLVPGGTILSSRDEILHSMGGPPWAWYRIKEPCTLVLGSDAGLIAYRVQAQRAGGEVYSALISSVYVRRGSDWPGLPSYRANDRAKAVFQVRANLIRGIIAIWSVSE